MIREFHLADWFTLGNAVCGVGALFSAMSYLATQDVVHIYFAAALVLAALACALGASTLDGATQALPLSPPAR